MYQTLSLQRLSNHFTTITLLAYCKSMSPLFIFIFFHNSHIFPVTSNCTKAAYCPIKKILNQCWRIKNIVKIKHTLSIFEFLRQTQNNCFTKPKLCFFSFFAKIKIKLMQIYCFAAASTPPLETPFYWLPFHLLLT